MYKYSLDRSSRKYICPQCGKKTFVRYVNNESNDYLEENIGRCDRESKCKYHCRPNGNQPIVNIDNLQIFEPEPTFLNFDVVNQSLKNEQHNNFILYLEKHFSRCQIDEAIKKYFIGNSDHWHGATIFWQIDENNNVRTGKVMLYDTYTGKRVKKPFPHINWIHRVYRIKDFVLQQCLFGIHNLNKYGKGDTICIVESGKTAVIMSIVCPHYLWLATGSKSNFKEKLLKPLKDYNVIVYPDKSEFEDWNRKIQYLNKKGYNFRCSKFLEDKGEAEGADLVDLILLEE